MLDDEYLAFSATNRRCDDPAAQEDAQLRRERAGRPRYSSTRPRCAFVWERWRFSARRRSLEARVAFVARRTFGGTALRANCSRSFCTHSWRLRNWLRDSRDVAVMPLGTCVMRTAESVVFTHCPPGPLARNACTSQSRAMSSSGWRAQKA